MSSRLMPPKLLEIRAMVSTSLSTSLVSTQMGKASTPPNSLKRAHLPSITGIPGGRADVPQAQHRGAVGDHRHQIAPGG